MRIESYMLMLKYYIQSKQTNAILSINLSAILLNSMISIFFLKSNNLVYKIQEYTK